MKRVWLISIIVFSLLILFVGVTLIFRWPGTCCEDNSCESVGGTCSVDCSEGSVMSVAHLCEKEGAKCCVRLNS